MPTQITRQNDGPTSTVTFTASNGTTGGFNLAIYSGAMIHVQSVANGATTLTWKTQIPNDPLAGVFGVADKTDTAITTTIQAGRSYPLPDELFAASYVLATTNAGTAVCRITVKG